MMSHIKLGSSTSNMRVEINPYPTGELTKSLLRLDLPWRRQAKSIAANTAGVFKPQESSHLQQIQIYRIELTTNYIPTG